MSGSNQGRGVTHQIVGDGSSLPLVGSKRRRRTFDVFISFRGLDTRRGFTSHLHRALCEKGIDVFVDDRLERGDEISEALVEGIHGSLLSLVVFSEDYASSRWCLEELVQILRCRKTMDQLVIPIFHNVDPSHVRWQKQSFAAAFERHEERYTDDTEKVNRWRSALHEVANLSGHNSSEFTSDSMLVDAVVRDTLEKLHRISRRPNPNNGLVGIDSRMKKVLGLLGFGAEDIRVVGIWGMGGIGKTTLAEAVFDEISGGFEGSYFFRNVRETEEKGDLIEKSFLVGRLRRKRVLVVLDDVNHHRQLEVLLKGLDEWGSGSRVIITTRDRQVLSLFPKEIAKVYRAEGLNNAEALRLFGRNAYVPGPQTERYDELKMKVVHYASGIPLEKLRSLDVSGTAVQQLPPIKEETTRLTGLRGCDSRDPVALSVPPLSRVCSLRTLKMSNLDIEHLPEDIGRLTSLTRLDLGGNDFKTLPASIKHLSKLEELDVSYCRRLESLPELPKSLWRLNANGCAYLETIWDDMEFGAGLFEGSAEFGNCLRLQEDARVKIVAAAKLSLQTARKSGWYDVTFRVCLPGCNIPDWFTHWERGPTLHLPPGLCEAQRSEGLALCVSVAFTDCSLKSGLYICAECCFDDGEGEDPIKLPATSGLTVFKIKGARAQSQAQREYIRSDHLFFFYDSFPLQVREYDCASTMTFHLLDGKHKPLECCKVEKCGYYIVPA